MPFYSGNREFFLQNRHNVQEQKKRFPRIRGQKKKEFEICPQSRYFFPGTLRAAAAAEKIC